MSHHAELERSFEGVEAPWHALWTAMGQERRVFDTAQAAGYAVLLPQSSETIIVRGRVIDRRSLVIPRYVFVRFDAWRSTWGELLEIEGVSGIVCHGHIVDRTAQTKRSYELASIPERDMDDIIACGDDYDRIFDWLVRTGRIDRKSNRWRKKQDRQKRYIANLQAA